MSRLHTFTMFFGFLVAFSKAKAISGNSYTCKNDECFLFHLQSFDPEDIYIFGLTILVMIRNYD